MALLSVITEAVLFFVFTRLHQYVFQDEKCNKFVTAGVFGSHVFCEPMFRTTERIDDHCGILNKYTYIYVPRIPFLIAVSRRFDINSALPVW